MNRIGRLQSQLAAAPASSPGVSADARGPPPTDVFLSPASDAPGIDRHVYDAVLTPAAVAFVADVAAVFRLDVAQILHTRSARRQQVEQHGWRPDFLEETREIREDETWTVDWVPEALRDRRVDVGDVSPAETELLLRALNSGAQGVQVDLDDGHCPTWTNTLRGHKNIMDAARGRLSVPSAGLEMSANPALLLVRPRAWNMDEPVG
jgi:malate synthase